MLHGCKRELSCIEATQAKLGQRSTSFVSSSSSGFARQLPERKQEAKSTVDNIPAHVAVRHL